MSYRDDYRKVEREVFWTAPRIVIMVLVALLAVYGIGFLTTGGDLAMYSFWAPKQAAAENQVFHHTQMFIDGKNETIATLHYNYQTADVEHKAIIRSLALEESVTIDPKDLTGENLEFIQQLKQQ